MTQAPEPVKPQPLSYESDQSNMKTVVVARGANDLEASLYASRLEAAGIECLVLNSHTNALGAGYNGGTSVEVAVSCADEQRAQAVLRQNDDDLEPVEDAAEIPLDEQSNRAAPIEVARFESLAEMREAQLALTACNIDVFPPALAPRGDRPRGAGPRFILRTNAEDLERAKLILDEIHQEQRRDPEPRCPKCGSYRVALDPGFWGWLAAFGLARSSKIMKCLRCQYRDDGSAFGATITTGGFPVAPAHLRPTSSPSNVVR